MSTLELKIDLLDLISREENRNKLVLLRAFMHRYLLNDEVYHSIDDDIDFEEPEWLVERLDNIMEEFSNGTMEVISHEDFKQQLKMRRYENNMDTAGNTAS